MAGLRSGGRKLSFDVLTTADSFFDDDDGPFIHRSTSGPPIQANEGASTKTRRKKRRNKKKNKAEDELGLNCNDDDNATSGCNYYSRLETTMPAEVVYGEVVVVPPEEEEEIVRTVISNDDGDNLSMVFTDEDVKECIGSSCVIAAASSIEFGSEMNLNINGHGVRKRKEESLEFTQVIPKSKPKPKLKQKFSVETLPVKYFMEEMYGASSLRTTTSLADEKERERVYDTIFRLPWRCELLIDVGFFICLDSFLSVLTIMPMRILTTSWRLLKTRYILLHLKVYVIKQFKITSSEELSDLGCCLIMACGIILLQQTDISLIYHMIRGQGTIKLYVVYNILEILDRLCQNFGGDVLQTLFNSAHGLANCPSECRRYWLWRFISDEALAVAITLSTCMVAHNNALFALLVSNNFSEIKSNVFKRFSKENIQQLVYFDSIERFHISAFLIFILAQNILEAEGAWFENFLYNALVVHICEMMVDIVKHSFIAKFNEVKPIVYSEFLEDLCKQTLNIETGNGKNNLTFVPLAPACVVIRALSPIYAAHLPTGPILWRLLWIFILMVMMFVMLTSFKVMIGMALHKHSSWHVKRCQGAKLHSD
ncbi:hypothetical protein OSB04_018161 [Centaurea solstitialis]|uniref:Protein POLLEN DEFECTIVE IN GUIDANCE 1 n=1 Tax=Centaurea solstitialis TaxID=347529 RepID=A0AA38THH1_9ASTR|nr:hypothetical protein OSB04_018161 [Centaurea solstitialis]